MTPQRAAERAVVGAVLLQPERFVDVREWLEPDDFYGTAEQQAYAAICSVAGRGEEVSPEAVDREVRAAARPGGAPPLADGAYLIGCLQVTPVAARAAVYGRMVLEMSIRRRVAEQGTRIRQRAERAVSTHDLTLVFARVDSARRNVEHLHDREAQATRSHSPTPLRADALPPLHRPRRREDVPAERVAIRALVDRPFALSTVTRWLNADDFSDQECSSLYGELATLHATGKPIDTVTVAWRALHAGLKGPICESLADARDPADVSPDPVRACRTVLQQSVRARVLSTAHTLEQSTNIDSSDVTAEAYARLNALWLHHRRLTAARMA